MHQPRAMGAGSQRDLLGAVSMDRVEALAPALGQNADQIDQHLGIASRSLDRGRMTQIGLHGVDLADAAEGLEEVGKFGPAHRHPDAVVALGQGSNHVTAKKAGAAIDGDEGVGVGSSVHSVLLSRKGPRQSGKYRIGREVYRVDHDLQLTSRKLLRT